MEQRELRTFKNFKHNTDIGQNFLRDNSVAKWMVARADLDRNARVLEIGPGKGILTKEILASDCNSLSAVELDSRLREFIEPIADRDRRLALHWGDAVTFDYSSLNEPPTHVIANLPYHITTPLIWKLLESLSNSNLHYMLFMVQKEVAERLAAKSSSRESNPLAITLSMIGEVAVPRNVGRTAFFPIPHVDSSIVEIKLNGNHRSLPADRVWRRLLSGSFVQRRKTLLNNWAGAFGISKATGSEILASHALPPLSRPEELQLEKWLELYEDEYMIESIRGKNFETNRHQIFPSLSGKLLDGEDVIPCNGSQMSACAKPETARTGEGILRREAMNL